MSSVKKVLVVEDETWVRRGLLHLIPWNDLGLELISEAEDGEAAYEMAMNLRPDIVILDMNMPGWDGRELMRHLYKSAPDLIIIVISGYSDFEYTREAIRYNTFEYLLKPVKKDELVSVLTKAIQHIDERANTSESLTPEAWLYNQLFRGYSDSEEELARIGVNQRERIERLIQLDKVIGIIQLENGSWGDSLEKVVSIFKKRLEMNGNEQENVYYLFNSPENPNEAVFVLSDQQFQMKYVKTMLQSVVKDLAVEEISVSIAVTDMIKKTDEIRKAFFKAQKILSGKSVRSTQQLLDSQEPSLKTTSFYPQEAEHRFLMALQNGNIKSAETALHDFFLALDHQKITVGMLRQAALLFIHSVEKWTSSYDSNLEFICGYNPLSISERFKVLNSPSNMKGELMEMWLPDLPEFFRSTLNTGGFQITKDVVKVIENSYYLPLSLQEIAESRHMNADYLSRLFKKVTSSNFVDYLTDYRINKAKQFMETSHYKNYEIASMVGYEDYRYFSQVFKKRMGMTIGEYRQVRASDTKKQKCDRNSNKN